MALSKFLLDAFSELIEGGVGGLLPFNHFSLTKRALAHSISNRMSLDLKFPRQPMATTKFLSDALRENTRFGVVGVIYSPITLNLNRGTITFDYQSNEAPSKFRRSPFLYVPYMPPGHNLLCPEGCMGVCHDQRNNFWSFQLH